MVEIRFPKWADSPPQFLLWELDEMAPVAICFVIFLPARSLITGFIVAIILTRIYIHLKKTLPAFFYLHYLWFWGVYKPKTKNLDLLKGYLTYHRE